MTLTHHMNIHRERLPVLLLRILHGAFALYFIICIAILYRSVFTQELDIWFIVAILSLATEGLLVFVMNGGDCPLIHIQRKLDDDVPFFNLFLPAHLAKKAVPLFTGVTLVGILLLIMRLIMKI